MKWIALSASLVVVLVGCRTHTPPPPATQSAQTFETKVVRQVRCDYLLSLPKDYDAKSPRTWPLVIFLHGSGERGADVNKVKMHGPPKLVAAGQQFGFILVSPQCSPDVPWRVDELKLLLDDIEKHYRIDRDREYITGLSMGGMATWEWLLTEQNRFAAAVAICGPSGWVERPIQHATPVWVFHGDADKSVPLGESREMVEKFQKAGGEVKFTIYPGVGHNAWTQTYANPEMWTWLLSHRRGYDQ